MRADASRDWIIVDRQSGFILRGMTREEIGWIVNAPVDLIDAVMALKLTYETRDKIVVGEWRRK